MGLRIFTEPQQGASYDQLLAVARTAEELDFDAFFRSDHFLKMGAATGLPAYTDAWTTLAGLARDTSRIRLGTLVTPVTFREPGSFPILVAQVDQMSGGRVDLGLGAGWYEAEHQAYGLPFPSPSKRYDRLEDTLEILFGTWAAADGETFTYEGKTLSVSLQADSLRPAQRPHPPVILGGRGGPRNAALAARFADEFNIAFRSPSEATATYDSVRAACERVGRDPGSIIWSAAFVCVCGADELEVTRRAAAIGREVPDLRANGLCGTPDEILEKLATYTAVGVERVYLQFLDLSDLDHLRLVAEAVQPLVSLR
jgi:F420-dependent oxidoreductase-like protein